MPQSHLLWDLFKAPRFTKSDLNLVQLIKAGKEGVFYQARMTRGTCKGHSMFTCKISKEGTYFSAVLDLQTVLWGRTALKADLIQSVVEVKDKVQRERTTIYLLIIYL